MSELLKISQLAERAGVQKATVSYYIKEGLLPRPARKPHRNMAYYHADMVERIKLIKDLQTNRFMPLAVIKKMLGDKRGIQEIRSFVASQPLRPQAPAPSMVEAATLIAETGFSALELSELAAMGYIRKAKSAGKTMYNSAEVAIVHAVSNMRKAGLGEVGGFGAQELAMYKEAMEELIRKELTMFSERVVGRLPRKDVLSLARAGLEGTNELLIALRRKIFMDFLGETADVQAKPARPKRVK